MTQFDEHPRRLKLPVWPTVRESFRATFRHLPMLIRLTWPWMLLMIAAATTFGSIAPVHSRSSEDARMWLMSTATALISFGLAAIIAVPWHRLILLDERNSAFATPASTASIVSYFSLGAQIMLVSSIPDVLSLVASFAKSGRATTDFTQNGWVLTCLFVIYIYVASRLSLAFPALALGHENAVRRAWDAGRDNVRNLFFGSFLVALPMIVLLVPGTIYLIKSSSSAAPPPPSYVSIWLATSCVINLAVGMSYVTFLSLSYRHFFGISEPRPQHYS